MSEFVVTESAAGKIKSILEKNKDSNNIALRVAVDGGGCSGFKYNYSPAEQIEEDDLVFTQNDVKVIIDKISFEFVKGSKLDFVQELGGEYFEISNPNIKSGCGCGNSFSI
jgi:iron-sulfur cluster insertion protein